MWPRPAPTWNRSANGSGAPISSEIAAPRSLARDLYTSTIFVSSATRSSRVVCENDSNARRAAATALSTSAAEPSAMSYSGCSLAGLITGRVFGVTGSTQAPSM